MVRTFKPYDKKIKKGKIFVVTGTKNALEAKRQVAKKQKLSASRVEERYIAKEGTVITKGRQDMLYWKDKSIKGTACIAVFSKDMKI